MDVTKEMSIREVLMKDPGTARIFMEFGMHCLGCPAAQAETLEEACAVHGVDADIVAKAINARIAETK